MSQAHGVMRRATTFEVPPAKRFKKSGRKGKTTKDKAAEALRKINALQRAVELKTTDTSDLADSVPYDGANSIAVFTPAQGNTNVERVGDQIQPKWIELRGSVNYNTTSSNTNQTVRITVCRSKQRFTPAANTAGDDATALYQSGGGASAVFSPFDYENRRHFVVLHDETFTVGDTGGHLSEIPFSIKINCPKSYELEFDEGTTSAEGGQYYLVMTSDTANASNPPFVAYFLRGWYTDI